MVLWKANLLRPCCVSFSCIRWCYRWCRYGLWHVCGNYGCVVMLRLYDFRGPFFINRCVMHQMCVSKQRPEEKSLPTPNKNIPKTFQSTRRSFPSSLAHSSTLTPPGLKTDEPLSLVLFSLHPYNPPHPATKGGIPSGLRSLRRKNPGGRGRVSIKEGKRSQRVVLLFPHCHRG